MMSNFLCILALAVAREVGANSLRGVPVKPHSDEAEVDQLRKKLTKVSGGFSALLNGPTNRTHVGSMMARVAKEVKETLNETAKPKDIKNALARLLKANGAVKQLSVDMADEQARLMHEGEAQEQSLLLGIMMQRQKEPLSKQMEVMNDPQFVHLACVKAVLAAKDTKTPLFQQLAAYLDAHAPKSVVQQPADAIPDKLKVAKDGKPDVTPIVLALEARLRKMEQSRTRMEEHHKASDAEMDKAMTEKKNQTRLVLQIRSVKKRDDRDFKKHVAMAKHDIESLRAAIEAVKKGDMAGLQRAQQALDSSMKAAQSVQKKFLYLIQLSVETKDCPFCVAQCVDKCHTAGKPYVACLTDCADAGSDK